ncbi:MAG: hypothetical protein COA58_13325 [Bacteroidetes bacterium]|nr:MAG: hypothetical protein COA58_13325 [Bacteroidota bacterium]
MMVKIKVKLKKARVWMMSPFRLLGATKVVILNRVWTSLIWNFKEYKFSCSNYCCAMSWYVDSNFWIISTLHCFLGNSQAFILEI